jgi:ppGpp synthetase/RelA/SpoT-type nucleotidyltranferase
MAIKPKVDPNSDEISGTYLKLKPKYENLGINLTQAIKQFLNESDIKVLSVDHRVKDETSLSEKIERKEYKNPLEQIEDLCGIRIICYYQSDVDEIGKIIAQEFEVLENEDKEGLLEADQFGYRSTHYIVKIKKNWLKAPNYRGLENLKAEIQVRTVLMHAWAEIEHKLSYKKDTHIPKQFKRMFSRLSAKLEEADEQFEILKTEITNYREDIVEFASNERADVKNVELNLDSLQAFLDAILPDKRKSPAVSKLLDEFLTFGITLSDLLAAFENLKKYLPEIEKEMPGTLTQTGIVRCILDLTDTNYRANRSGSPLRNPPDRPAKERGHIWSKTIEKWADIIHSDDNTKSSKKNN